MEPPASSYKYGEDARGLVAHNAYNSTVNITEINNSFHTPINTEKTRTTPFVLHQRDDELFKGRDTEVDTLARLLLRSDLERRSRIAAITGMPGIGKSVLASRFANSYRDKFPDGVISVDANSKDIYQISLEIERILKRYFPKLNVGTEYGFGDIRRPEEVIADAIGNREMLIIYDNVGMSSIDRILPNGDNCAVIITTQYRKSGSLQSIHPSRIVRLSPLSTKDCEILFATVLGKKRTEQQQSEVIKLIKVLGGHPLALRIAIARLQDNDLTIAEYIDSLNRTERRLKQLHKGNDLERRLEATLIEAWERLDTTEQEFLASLSLCASSGFSCSTAAVTSGINNVYEVAELLDLLEGCSLIDWAGDSGERSKRARLHPFLRNFCTTQARKLNIVDIALQRHSNWFIKWLESVIITDDQTSEKIPINNDIADQIAAELDDIIIASEWVIKHAGGGDQSDTAYQASIFEKLFPILANFGHWQKALVLVERLSVWAHTTSEWARVARFRMHQARFLSKLERHDDAVEVLERYCIPASKLITTLSEALMRESKIYNVMGDIYQRKGDHAKSISAFLLNAQLDEQLGDARSLAIVSNRLGTYYRKLNNPQEALNWFEKQLEQATSLLDLELQRRAWNGISLAHQALGDYDQTLYSLKREIELSSDLRDLTAWTLALSRQGFLYLNNNHYSEAVLSLKQAINLSHALGKQAQFYSQLGKIRMIMNEFDRASMCFKKSLWLAINYKDDRQHLISLCQLGNLLHKQKKYLKAYETYLKAFDLHIPSKELFDSCYDIQYLAFCLSRLHFYHEAKAICTRIIILLSGRTGYINTLSKAHSVMGFLYDKNKLFGKALCSYQESLLALSNTGIPSNLAKPMTKLLMAIKKAGSSLDHIFDTAHKINVVPARMLWLLYADSSDILCIGNLCQLPIIEHQIQDAQNSNVYIWEELGKSIRLIRAAGYNDKHVDALLKSSCQRIADHAQILPIQKGYFDYIHFLAVLVIRSADSLSPRTYRDFKKLLYYEAEYIARTSLELPEVCCESRIKCLNTLAKASRRRGKYAAAEDSLREAFDLSSEFPNLQVQVATLLGYTIAMQTNRSSGDYLRYIELGFSLSGRLDDKLHLCVAHFLFSKILQCRPLDGDAMGHMIKSYDTAASFEPPKPPLLRWATKNLVNFLLEHGKVNDAKSYCINAIGILGNDSSLEGLFDRIAKVDALGARRILSRQSTDSSSIPDRVPLRQISSFSSSDFDDEQDELYRDDDLYSD
jgi:tetratricopeptide (TPR) repeat protein